MSGINRPKKTQVIERKYVLLFLATVTLALYYINMLNSPKKPVDISYPNT